MNIIRGDIQKLLAVNANEKLLTIDLALGLIGAFMLKKCNASISEWGAMVKYLKYLRTECFKGGKRLFISDYSFTECALCIHSFLSSQPFERKRGFLNSFELKVITEIDDNGYLSFNDKTFNIYATQQMIGGVPAPNYILTDVTTEDNIVEDNNNTDNNIADNNVEEVAEDSGDSIITEVEEIVNNENLPEQETTTTENPVSLAIDYDASQRNSCTDNTPFIQLYDELIAANPEDRINAEFVWQWFLTSTEYKAIKACLTNNKLQNPSNWDNRTIRLLALYVGEFYKREYENNLAPFTQLGENVRDSTYYSSKICEKLKIEPYRGDNKAYLHTLYVNGGLPIHFISSKLDNAQSNKFIDGLSKLLDAENEIDISEGEEELGKFSSNISLRESYQGGSGHSIFEYIQAIMTGNMTWDDSDNESDDFRGFINKVKEANNKAAERKKFKLFYSLWTYSQELNLLEFSLMPQIRFNPEEDGDRHYAISLQRLANWGIKNPPAQFSLRLGDNEMKFTRCINGDYISWNMTDRIDLNRLDRNLTIDDLLHSDFTIVFDRLNAETSQIKNDFNLPFKKGYLQFYTDDDPSMASWNSFKGTHSFLWSGLMYDKNRYHLLSPVTITNINEELGWVTFSDCVAFEDRINGKVHSFFNSKGRIYAKPSEDSLHKNIIDSPCLLPNCLLDGMAKCTIGGEQSHAYIVKSSNLKFDVLRVTNDEKVNSNPIVEYKSAQEYQDPLSSWKQYGSRNLDQGLYVFRLFNARYSTEVKCHILPDNAEIVFQSTSIPYLIRFIGFSNVSSEGRPSTERDNSTIFNIDNNVDSFDFTIGDEHGSILLQTYHPKPQTHVYLYGKEIYINNDSVLIAYADEIEVKNISANSFKNCHLYDNKQIYDVLFRALTATVTGKDYEFLMKRNKIHIDDSILKVRVYTQDINKTQNAAIKLMLLDFENNHTDEIYGTNPMDDAQRIVKEYKHDGLLFQSLKDVDYTDTYCVPKFIPQNGRKLANNAKAEDRRLRLTQYVKESVFVTGYAYKQFEIACEHKLYFAVFDSLLCMCWNAKNEKYKGYPQEIPPKPFLDVKKNKQFKINIHNFLKGYVDYTLKKDIEPSITGLRRMAKEFLFDWEIIKRDIEVSDSQQLQILYQEIINK